MAVEIDNSRVTIVSLLPYDLHEPKPGLTPNEFHIVGRNADGPGLSILPDGVYYLVNPDLLANDKEVRQIKVPVPAMELAQSIIYDYVSALIATDPPDTVPGLFAVKGDYTDPKLVKMKFAKQLETYNDYQNKWFQALVDIADDTWSKTKSPLGISDIQRSAAKSLGFKREWINPTPIEMQTNKCPVCMNAVNEGALKCISCGYILDKVKYNELVKA